MEVMLEALRAQPAPPRTTNKKGHPDLRGGVSFKPLSLGVLKQLHKELGLVFPDLLNVSALSSQKMDGEFQNALASTTSGDFKDHYLEANVLKRFQSTKSDDMKAREDAAVRILLESEVRCAVSNEQLYGVLSEDRAWVPTHVRSRLLRAKKILHGLLGDFDWEELPRACNFSPGATTEFSRKTSAIHNKWALSTQITPKALPYLWAFQGWAGLDLLPDYDRNQVLCLYNEVFTVPKNFERDRTACKPVTWNAFFQKGVGKMVKRRLQRKKQLLLPDAQVYHQVLARIGSATGAISTLDLKGASDGICLALVSELFPASWVKVLFDLREEYGKLPDGTIVQWEKLSTMGNGFTFEVETALFYALAAACCSDGSLVSVYGDDIIVPTRYADEVIELMLYCGFEMNREKTFTTGSFRESCGGHYYAGVDVKPFYITELPSDMNDVINLHNDIMRWVGGYPREGSRFFNVWRRCRSLVPRSAWGPPGKQGCLWAEWDDCRPEYCPNLKAFKVKGVAWEMVQHDISNGIGGYLQKLWERDHEPTDASEHSSYRETGERIKGCWLIVDRAQWKRVTAETLCT